MIDKSCGYKMASESESDSSSRSLLHSFLQKIEDVARIFHRMPASEASQAARALRSVADRLCVAAENCGVESPAERSDKPMAMSGLPAAGSAVLPSPQPSAALPLPKDVVLSSVLSTLTNRLDVGEQSAAWRGPKRTGDGKRRLGKAGVPKPLPLLPPPPPQPQQTASSTPEQATSAVRAVSSSAVTANGCSHCGKQFSCAAKLVEHRRTHTGERPFVCHICNRAFSVKSNMTRHVVDTHGLKDAAVGRCGRRARPLVARSSSSSSSNNSHAAPPLLPAPLPCSADDVGDVEVEPCPARSSAAASPPPPKIARHHLAVVDGLVGLHRLNRRKSQPRKLDSVIDSLHESLPCTVDDTDETPVGHEDDAGVATDGRAAFSTTGEPVTKRNRKHSSDVDEARMSATGKPLLQLQDVSNGSGRREELWLSCDRGYRQASPY